MAWDFTFTTRHIHNCALFPLWLSLFIPSGVISPLFSSSILGTYQPGEFIFQCPIFMPFHAVHGILKAGILKWLPLPSWVDHILSELSTMTHPSWVEPHNRSHSFIELSWAVVHVIRLVSFLCDCGFHSLWPLMEKDKRLMETSDGKDWQGETGSCSDRWGHTQ